MSANFNFYSGEKNSRDGHEKWYDGVDKSEPSALNSDTTQSRRRYCARVNNQSCVSDERDPVVVSLKTVASMYLGYVFRWPTLCLSRIGNRKTNVTRIIMPFSHSHMSVPTVNLPASVREKITCVITRGPCKSTALRNRVEALPLVSVTNFAIYRSILQYDNSLSDCPGSLLGRQQGRPAM